MKNSFIHAKIGQIWRYYNKVSTPPAGNETKKTGYNEKKVPNSL